MIDSVTYYYTVSKEDGKDNGGNTPPISVFPFKVPSGNLEKGKTYTRHYHFDVEEAEEMLCALVAELDFLHDLRLYVGEGPLEEENFSLPLIDDSETLPDDWLPF